MKLFYWFTLIFLTTSLYIRAQSFTLSELDGTVINNGDTVVVSGTVEEQILMANARLKNNSPSSKIVKVRKTELSLAAGSGNAFAWGLLEYAPSVIVSQGVEISSTMTDTSFVSFYFAGGFTGISFIQYTFFDENNPADSAWLVVKYEVLQVSGITGVNPSVIAVFPNPVHGVATILSSIASVGMIPVLIRNSAGAVVYVGFPERGKLLFDASRFPAGYYTIEAGNARLKLMKQ